MCEIRRNEKGSVRARCVDNDPVGKKIRGGSLVKLPIPTARRLYFGKLCIAIIENSSRFIPFQQILNDPLQNSPSTRLVDCSQSHKGTCPNQSLIQAWRLHRITVRPGKPTIRSAHIPTHRECATH